MGTHLCNYWLYVKIPDIPREVQVGYTDYDVRKDGRLFGNDHIYAQGTEQNTSWMGALLLEP